jgi:hypothetical protein
VRPETRERGEASVRKAAIAATAPLMGVRMGGLERPLRPWNRAGAAPGT